MSTTLGAILIGLFAATPTGKQEDMMSGLEWLTQTTREMLVGCRTTGWDGTILYTPDMKAHYRALWTRDFAYMVIYAGDLLPQEHIEACIRYILRGQRTDGAVPDRVRPDGVPVYVAGPEDHPLGEPNLDNPPFLVLAVDSYLQRLEPKAGKKRFREWATSLDKGMDYVPRGANGLVYNDENNPHSPYGFTDTVCKTGDLFMESLLYWLACRQIAFWHEQVGNEKKGQEYKARANLIENHIGELWDEQSSAFFSATKDCRQIDIWGNAYALVIGFPLGEKRPRMLKFLKDNYEKYVYCGQVRHLLEGEYWQRMLTDVPRDRYQNGAYWATASGWVMVALSEVDRDLSQRMFIELIKDFRNRGICECIHEGYRNLEGYVVSATNVLGAARQLGLND